jgi:hypothetical protein
MRAGVMRLHRGAVHGTLVLRAATALPYVDTVVVRPQIVMKQKHLERVQGALMPTRERYLSNVRRTFLSHAQRIGLIARSMRQSQSEVMA